MAPQISETESLSTTIAKKKLKLLGHILRLSADCPAKKAMRYYFEERNNKMFTGRKRTTIVSRIKADIKNKKKKNKKNEKHIDFPITPLISLVNLSNMKYIS